MPNDKLRRQIAWEAARLMYDREEAEYFRAKRKAADRLGHGRIKPADLPSNAEIRDQIQSFARSLEGDQRSRRLGEMRLAALRMMRLLAEFHPRLIGSVLTGHVRHGSDIDIHVFCDSTDSILAALEREGLAGELERKQVLKQGEQRTYLHVHVQEQFRHELTVYASRDRQTVFRSSITNKPIERASIREVEALLEAEHPEIDLEGALLAAEISIDIYRMYEALLVPLERVRQDPRYHPEGDALYHSLQVFELARREHPYDEELLAAALLHDVGKAIDPYDHVKAGLEALAGLVTERTAWLVEHHMLGHALGDGSLGVRAQRRLRESEYFDDLLALTRYDRGGRQPGAEVPDVTVAIDYLRRLGSGDLA